MSVRINLSFSGWIRGLLVKQVTDVATGNKIPVPDNMTADEVASKLSSGDWAISLAESLGDNGDADDDEIEIFDFEKTD